MAQIDGRVQLISFWEILDDFNFFYFFYKENFQSGFKTYSYFVFLTLFFILPRSWVNILIQIGLDVGHNYQSRLMKTGFSQGDDDDTKTFLMIILMNDGSTF